MSLPGEQQFTCRIELTKTGGIAIIVKDAKKKDQLQRKILLEGDGITLTCKNGQKSSTVTQKDDSLKAEVTTDKGTTTVEQDGEAVTVTCKTFKVTAETITLDASKTATFKTGETCTIESTKATTIDSSAGLTLKSAAAMSLDSKAGATMKATGSLSLEGAQASIVGKSQLSLTSQGAASCDGMTVSVKGQTQATLEAPVTSVGLTMTTVKGQIVEVSGALVKLG